MEKIEFNQKAVQETLKNYERLIGNIQSHLIVDAKQGHYQILETGWQDKNTYYFNTPIHIHLKSDGKIWILENKTEDDIAQLLIERGVEKSDIVLSFLPERVRHHSGYAVN